MLDLTFTSESWEDYHHWMIHDRAILRRINLLLKDALRSPTAGIGKPEQLRYIDGAPWSRRITQEHRLVYSFNAVRLTVWQCRYHY